MGAKTVDVNVHFPIIDTVRNVLVIILVFFVAILFSGFILGPIITLLFFLFQYYYRKSKALEKQLANMSSGRTVTEMDARPPSAVPPPPSTDA